MISTSVSGLRAGRELQPPGHGVAVLDIGLLDGLVAIEHHDQLAAHVETEHLPIPAPPAVEEFLEGAPGDDEGQGAD